MYIVYALMTEQSIGDLSLAGIIPGIFIADLFRLSIYIRCSGKKSHEPVGRMLGNFTEKVVRKAHFPVLVVPEKDEP